MQNLYLSTSPSKERRGCAVCWKRNAFTVYVCMCASLQFLCVYFVPLNLQVLSLEKFISRGINQEYHQHRLNDVYSLFSFSGIRTPCLKTYSEHFLNHCPLILPFPLHACAWVCVAVSMRLCEMCLFPRKKPGNIFLQLSCSTHIPFFIRSHKSIPVAICSGLRIECLSTQP